MKGEGREIGAFLSRRLSLISVIVIIPRTGVFYRAIGGHDKDEHRRRADRLLAKSRRIQLHFPRPLAE